MQYIIILLTFLSLGVSSTESKKIVLSQSSIGDLEITKGMDISLYKVSKYFPLYHVTQSIGAGDSPDFHIFTVSTQTNEDIIRFISYIDEKSGDETGGITLDEVITCSNKVVDEFGISPGMDIKAAISARDSLDFGAGHMDYYLGKDHLWYLFYVDKTLGASVSKNIAINSKPQIDCISWPYARWR